jgi:hypothetical protein
VDRLGDPRRDPELQIHDKPPLTLESLRKYVIQL